MFFSREVMLTFLEVCVIMLVVMPLTPESEAYREPTSRRRLCLKGRRPNQRQVILQEGQRQNRMLMVVRHVVMVRYRR